MSTSILTINAGSSSLKFAVFSLGPRLTRIVEGKFERIGLADSTLSVVDLVKGRREQLDQPCADHAACVGPLVAVLAQTVSLTGLHAIGHRVVHGGPRFREPQQITGEILAELQRLSPFVPEHLPSEILLIESLGRHWPHVPQIACFDTAFHRDMPSVAQILPIPRRYCDIGVRRYGFHGLSYAFLMEELERVAGRTAAQGRVVLAHLGNGASMAAVHHGKGIDTTMAFTPTAGLVMSRRSGDLDPGLFSYLARVEGMTGEQFHQMVNTQSGLLGISEISPDIRDLLEQEATDVSAAEAVAVFCYQARKWIAAMTAALGGLDTLVFAGGIGENSAVIRGRICEGLGFLGIEIDPTRNQAHAPVITKQGCKAFARVMHTDEELYIAQSVVKLLPPPHTSQLGTRRKDARL